MAKNQKFQSKMPYRYSDSPEPIERYDLKEMKHMNQPRSIFLNSVPSKSALITVALFVILILILIYSFY